MDDPKLCRTMQVVLFNQSQHIVQTRILKGSCKFFVSKNIKKKQLGQHRLAKLYASDPKDPKRAQIFQN